MELVLVFDSTHHAIMGEKILLDSGIGVRVMPLPSVIKEGCGICLRVFEGDYAKAIQLLHTGKVPISGVYSKREINKINKYEIYDKG